MFKNPLKYQQGGQVSQEQQKMLAAFVEWLPKRVKEFQGMQPEQIVEALNGMSKTPEGQKQVEQLMQQFQQEMSRNQAGMFKDGGKLNDFICKHAKGGQIKDCGCNEEGGNIEYAGLGEKLRALFTRKKKEEVPVQKFTAPRGPLGGASVSKLDGFESAPKTEIATPQTGRQWDYSGLSFNQAFKRAADNAADNGSKTFIWNGKKYGTRRSADWREKWNKNQENPEINEVLAPVPLDHPVVLPVENQPEFVQESVFTPVEVNTPSVATIYNPTRFATYTKTPFDSSIEGAPVSYHRVRIVEAVPSSDSPKSFSNGLIYKEEGGKVEKAKGGYKVKNASYEASVNAPGDTTRTKKYNYTTEKMQTYPNGAVKYQTTSNNDGYTTTRWDFRSTMPTFWQRVGSEGVLSALLNNPKAATPFDKDNWKNIIANHPEDPRNALKQENGGVIKGQGGLAGFLQNLGDLFKNHSRARLYDHDLNKSVTIDLPEDLVSTAYGWPGHDGVYNENGKIVSAGNLSDVLGRKGSDYTRTDYYDPSLNSINPYLYIRKIRTTGNASDNSLYYGDPVKRDTIITKSLLGIGSDKVVEHGSDEYNQVNAALDDKDSSKVYHRKLGKTYKLNK